MEIEKKTWPGFFEKVARGEKSFEVRLADFECKAGDILVLKEWDPASKKYTGRSIDYTPMGQVLRKVVERTLRGV